jgi:hypothetical protein
MAFYQGNSLVKEIHKTFMEEYIFNSEFFA